VDEEALRHHEDVRQRRTPAGEQRQQGGGAGERS